MNVLKRFFGWKRGILRAAEEFGDRILWTTSGLPLDGTKRADINECIVLGCGNPCATGRSFCAERHPSPADEVERLRQELCVKDEELKEARDDKLTAGHVARMQALEWACQEIDRKPLVLGADWKTSTKMPLWEEIDRIRDQLTEGGYRAL